MNKFIFLLPTAKSLAGLFIALTCLGSAKAAEILSLSGYSDEARYASDAEVRLSLIQWPDQAQLQAVETAWQDYRNGGEMEAFLEVVEGQQTSGYLFTSAATGYRIKYAWKEETGDERVMHFLVTPGLKTRNPYLWNTPNQNSTEFTFVQVKLDNDTGVAKSSLAGEIVANERGNLELQNFDSLSVFATMKDSTPYYLK